jgi:hypothetical protein
MLLVLLERLVGIVLLIIELIVFMVGSRFFINATGAIDA